MMSEQPVSRHCTGMSGSTNGDERAPRRALMNHEGDGDSALRDLDTPGDWEPLGSRSSQAAIASYRHSADRSPDSLDISPCASLRPAFYCSLRFAVATREEIDFSIRIGVAAPGYVSPGLVFVMTSIPPASPKTARPANQSTTVIRKSSCRRTPVGPNVAPWSVVSLVDCAPGLFGKIATAETVERVSAGPQTAADCSCRSRAPHLSILRQRFPRKGSRETKESVACLPYWSVSSLAEWMLTCWRGCKRSSRHRACGSCPAASFATEVRSMVVALPSQSLADAAGVLFPDAVCQICGAQSSPGDGDETAPASIR